MAANKRKCDELFNEVHNNYEAGNDIPPVLHAELQMIVDDTSSHPLDTTIGNQIAEHKEDLEKIGFDYQKPIGDFDVVKNALLVYKSIYGDLLVPAGYKIPADDQRYPTEARGMVLGDTVRAIRAGTIYREYKAELEIIGFSCNKQDYLIHTFIQIKESLMTYKALHGDLKVPVAYIIAADDTRYPENVRGIKLGNVVNGIRNKATYADHREELEAMGFLFDKQRSNHTFADVKEALQTYKALHGDLKVPYSRIIAADDTRYPENVRGMKLGSVVTNIRNSGTYGDHREELEAMGFFYDHLKRVSTFAEVKDALLTYKALYGDMNVPFLRIIAADDTRYAENVRGMKLGSVVSNIRNSGSFADHKEELKAMGFFHEKQRACHTFTDVKEALQTYKALHGDLKVPVVYSIADDDTRYPENVRGMKLGIVVRDIRHKGNYADHKEELEAMGFLLDQQKSNHTFADVKEALQTFKELHGDLKVPNLRVIAEDDLRYPENVRGMKLGSVVSNIRNKGTYGDHKEELEAIGFVYDYLERVSTFAEVKEALLTYKELHGDLKVPAAYSIAADDTRYAENVREMKLGSVVSNIRNKATYADHREELEAMGFLFNSQRVSHTFPLVKEALLTHKEWHGDLEVPYSRIIPADDTRYPENVRGMKLGNVLKGIRNNGIYADHREELEAMGFLFDKQRGSHTFAEVKEALLTYKTLLGDLEVPQRYIIAEHDTRYPENVRGMKLGNVVKGIRNNGIYADHREELEAMGFVYDHLKRVSNFDNVKEALQTYKALHGDLKVPYSRIIADDDLRYPENVRGMKLGSVVSKIRNSGTFADHKEELESMGFVYDQQIRVATFAEVKEALQTYKALHGDLKVPKSYIIAEDDIRYPERARGVKLGNVVKGIRNLGTYADHKEELEAMGFFHENQRATHSHTFAEVKEALQTYKELHGDLKVPKSYIIAEDDIRYPEKARGVKLGSVVTNIRNSGTYGDQREELEAMGFVYDHLKRVSTFEDVEEALLTYKALHGDLKVLQSYIIVEDDTRYPERVRGMKLGSVVSNIRSKGTYANHKEELEAMGFLFDRRVRSPRQK